MGFGYLLVIGFCDLTVVVCGFVVLSCLVVDVFWVVAANYLVWLG